MSNIDKAEEIIALGYHNHRTTREMVQDLADANLLAPEPHVVTSVEELEERAREYAATIFASGYGQRTAFVRGAIWQSEHTPARPPVTRKQVLEVVKTIEWASGPEGRQYGGLDYEAAVDEFMDLVNGGSGE